MTRILALLTLLAASPAMAGTITVQIVETGQTTLTKQYTVPDADIDRIQAAYQQAGNTAVNGNATRAQVFQNWIQSLLIAPTIAAVSAYYLQAEQAAVAPVVPPSIQ